nr:hypothetical protein CFP56_09543 [Quercus suber]
MPSSTDIKVDSATPPNNVYDAKNESWSQIEKRTALLPGSSWGGGRFSAGSRCRSLRQHAFGRKSSANLLRPLRWLAPHRAPLIRPSAATTA